MPAKSGTHRRAARTASQKRREAPMMHKDMTATQHHMAEGSEHTRMAQKSHGKSRRGGKKK